MTPTILMGILSLGLGALYWVISGVLSRFTSKSYAYLRPERDKEAFRRGNRGVIRLMGTFFLVFGILALLFGLVTAR